MDVHIDLFYCNVKFGRIYVCMWKTVKISFSGKYLSANDKSDRKLYIYIYIYIYKTFDIRELSTSTPGHEYIFKKYFQTSFYMKPLGQ